MELLESYTSSKIQLNGLDGNSEKQEQQDKCDSFNQMFNDEETKKNIYFLGDLGGDKKKESRTEYRMVLKRCCAL